MDYYKILGISKYSSLIEIKKAYHKKAHEYHPDKGGSDSKMKLVNNAYHEILKMGGVIKENNLSKERPSKVVFKCKTCGYDSPYRNFCLECWIKEKKKEKKERIHNIRSFMFCLNCDKSLYKRALNTLFCDTKCSRRYYKSKGNIKPRRTCFCGNCLSKEEIFRLNKIDIEKVFCLKHKEKMAIFTRLVGKKRAKSIVLDCKVDLSRCFIIKQDFPKF